VFLAKPDTQTTWRQPVLDFQGVSDTAHGGVCRVLRQLPIPWVTKSPAATGGARSGSL